YKNVPVRSLTSSTLVFWNDGNKTLHFRDVAESDPIRIEFGEQTKILRVDVARVSRDVVQLSPDSAPGRENWVLLRFSFLDVGDGALIRILHTGENVAPKLSGTIRGMPEGCTDLGTVLPSELVRRRRSLSQKMIRTLLIALLLCVGPLIILSGI